MTDKIKFNIKKNITLFFFTYVIIFVFCIILFLFNKHNSKIIFIETKNTQLSTSLKDIEHVNVKFININRTKYSLIYEKATKRYIVYKNYNKLLGYLCLSQNETLDNITENNLLDRINYFN